MLSLRLALVLFVMLQSCAYSVHDVYLSDFKNVKKSAKKPIHVTVEETVIFGFAFDTKYADLAYKKLLSKCKGGVITGLSTRYYTKLGFFHWKEVIEIDGFCKS